MDETSLDRLLREAPLPGLGEGHAARLRARLRAQTDARLRAQTDARLRAQTDARARRSRTQWRAAAAMVVLAGGLYAAFAWSSRGEPAVGRVVAVPVYWSRDVRVERLDISRWTCQGCKN
jgi:anti-sigma-K factor RskA